MPAGILRRRLGSTSKELVAALLPLTTHNRYRVRIAAIAAIKDAVHEVGLWHIELQPANHHGVATTAVICGCNHCSERRLPRPVASKRMAGPSGFHLSSNAHGLIRPHEAVPCAMHLPPRLLTAAIHHCCRPAAGRARDGAGDGGLARPQPCPPAGVLRQRPESQLLRQARHRPARAGGRGWLRVPLRRPIKLACP